MLSGEATVPTDVERLLDGARPHLTVTELPYGVHDDAQLAKCSWRLGNNLCRQGEQQSPTIRTPIVPIQEPILRCCSRCIADTITIPTQALIASTKVSPNLA